MDITIMKTMRDFLFKHGGGELHDNDILMEVFFKNMQEAFCVVFNILRCPTLPSKLTTIQSVTLKPLLIDCGTVCV